jgi:transcriptional regulator with GAF, ATPase, and Fis domain
VAQTHPHKERPEALGLTLERLHERDSGTELPDALRVVVETAQALFGVTGAGLMFVDDERVLRYVAATDHTARSLEQGQEASGSGPCVDAVVYDRMVQTADVTSDGRWPRLARELDDAARHAVLSVPVHVAGTVVGSLDAYMDGRYEWDEGQVRALTTYAGLVEGLLASALQAEQRARIAGQLQHALDNRVTIERAVGMIMGREGIDAVTAFSRIRRKARDRGRKVAVVAGEVLGGTALDEVRRP